MINPFGMFIISIIFFISSHFNKAGIAICLSLAQIDREVNKPPLLYRSLQEPFFIRGRTMLVQKGGPLKPMLDKQYYYCFIFTISIIVYIGIKLFIGSY